MAREVLVERDGAVLKLVMNRPDKKNALTGAMYQSLAEGLQAADAAQGVRAIMIQGAGGTFTAGNDLADFLTNPPRGRDSPVFRFLGAIATLHKPLVAAVEGSAVGIGTTMLLHCDFAYAADNARFALPFVNLGICPEAGSSFLLPLIAGHRLAARLLMLGEPFSADQAMDAGIITAAVAPSLVADTAVRVAQKLAEKPASALRVTKQLLKKQFQAQTLSALAEESESFARMLGQPAAREAMAAFLEKRKPDFSKFA